MKLIMPAEVELKVDDHLRFTPPYEATWFQGDNEDTVTFCKKYGDQECVIAELKESPLIASGDPFIDMDNIRKTIGGTRVLVRFLSTGEEHEIKTSWLTYLPQMEDELLAQELLASVAVLEQAAGHSYISWWGKLIKREFTICEVLKKAARRLAPAYVP